MSIESFNQFQRAVMQDSALQEQINSAATTSPESVGNLVVKLGAERGYSFTLEDIQVTAASAASNSSMEEALKDEDLEMVSGGIVPVFLLPSLSNALAQTLTHTVGPPPTPDTWSMKHGL